MKDSLDILGGQNSDESSGSSEGWHRLDRDDPGSSKEVGDFLSGPERRKKFEVRKIFSRKEFDLSVGPCKMDTRKFDQTDGKKDTYLKHFSISIIL